MESLPSFVQNIKSLSGKQKKQIMFRWNTSNPRKLDWEALGIKAVCAEFMNIFHCNSKNFWSSDYSLRPRMELFISPKGKIFTIVIFTSIIMASTVGSKVSTCKYYIMVFQQQTEFIVVLQIMILSDIINIFVKVYFMMFA